MTRLWISLARWETLIVLLLLVLFFALSTQLDRIEADTDTLERREPVQETQSGQQTG